MLRSLPDTRDEELLWRGPLVNFGTFSLPAGDAEVWSAGQVHLHPAVVFPRLDSVWVDREHHRSFVADLGCVVLCNLGQRLKRPSFSPACGNQADFFHFDLGLLLAAIEKGGGWTPPSPERPFKPLRLPVDDLTYALERAIMRYVCEDARPDAMLVEESLVHALARIFGSGSSRPAKKITARQRELAERARTLLAERATQGLRLPELAAALRCSVFHLCRTFHAVSGSTLHAYRLRLRLRASLDSVAESKTCLSSIAYDLGFSTHSHFTQSFRRAFGLTPSKLRRLATRQLVRILAEQVLSELPFSPKA